MRRLLHVISFTSDIERSKEFYRDRLGLTVGADTPFMVNFAPDGVGLVLLAVQPTLKKEVELCFESESVSEAVDRLRGRGVEFIDELRHLSFGSVIHFRDPEGNLLSLLQPGSGQKEPAARGETKARAAAGAKSAVAVAEAPARRTGLALSTAIVNVQDLAAAHAYYRNLLGLHVSVDSRAWVQFDTGSIRLALHSRRDRTANDLHLMQPVSFGLTVPDLDVWVDQARERGVTFVSAPADAGFGLTAEIVDPEGNVVVVREPVSEATLEERLAERFEDDDTPHQTSMHRPVQRVAHAPMSHLSVKPEYKAPKRTSRRADRDDDAVEPPAPASRAKASQSGTSAGTPDKPKRTAAKRAYPPPATGRLKKAEARTLEEKKRDVARASKSKPVKRASAKPARPKRAGKKPGRRNP